MEGADVVTPGPLSPPGRLHIRKKTQKSNFLLSQAFKWKKIVIVIPEMPSKTLVMVLKNLSDHWEILSNSWDSDPICQYEVTIKVGDIVQLLVLRFDLTRNGSRSDPPKITGLGSDMLYKLSLKLNQKNM